MKMWLAFNSVAIAALAAIQYLVIRQIGVMLSRLGPLGARSADGDGPRRGEYIKVQMEPVRQRMRRSPGDVLYLFGSRACSICRDIRQSAIHLAPLWRDEVQIAMIYDDTPSDAESETTWDGDVLIALNGSTVRDTLLIHSVPFGVRVDARDRVLGSGLVNAMSHVESLLELVADDAHGGQADVAGAQDPLVAS